jgi:hypothetical protein
MKKTTIECCLNRNSLEGLPGVTCWVLRIHWEERRRLTRCHHLGQRRFFCGLSAKTGLLSFGLPANERAWRRLEAALGDGKPQMFAISDCIQQTTP